MKRKRSRCQLYAGIVIGFAIAGVLYVAVEYGSIVLELVPSLPRPEFFDVEVPTELAIGVPEIWLVGIENIGGQTADIEEVEWRIPSVDGVRVIDFTYDRRIGNVSLAPGEVVALAGTFTGRIPGTYDIGIRVLFEGGVGTSDSVATITVRESG